MVISEHSKTPYKFVVVLRDFAGPLGCMSILELRLSILELPGKKIYPVLVRKPT